MTKKYTAFIFIILANIVLLAHAVIPHHHHHNNHENDICFNGYSSETEVHNNCEAQHNHHEGEENSDSCVLKQSVVVPSVRSEFSLVNIINDCDYLQSYKFNPLFFDDVVKSFYPVVSSINQFIVLHAHYSCFVSVSIGLRAPPVV